MSANIPYRCPEPGCNLASLTEDAAGLHCANGHFFAYATNTRVPVFACEAEDSNEYALADAAQIHDNALRWVFQTFGTDEATLRKSLVARLRLAKGQTVLVTGAGAGNDLPFLVDALGGSGRIYAQDIARQMLLAGVDRHGELAKQSGVEIFFSASDATSLPFDAAVFDAAYHFGGLNLFPDIGKGIAEMNRVVKPGGRIVISDEGLAPWMKTTELGKMLIRNNPLYLYDAPLAALPDTARDVHVSWELANCFYVIDFTVGDAPPRVDIDVPHVGRRGGSIRTRYFGQLEGVDPALRDRAYAEAEKRGMSRVEYLEQLLRRGL